LVWKTTKQGQEFCAALPPEVIKPNISAIWAEKQAQIKSGELTVEDFIRDNDDYIRGLIDDLDKTGLTFRLMPRPALSVAKVFCANVRAEWLFLGVLMLS
jgi:DNA topoisomerase-3